jgi:hypothetical protein
MRRVCLHVCGAALSLADAVASLLPRPFHATPLPVPRYALVTHSAPRRRPSSATSPPLLPMPRRPCQPGLNAGVRYLSPFFPPARLYPVPLSRLDSIPARQTMEEKFLCAANCLYPSTSAAAPSTRVALRLPHSRSVPIPFFVSLQKYSPLTFPPETQVSVVFSIPPQSATSRWRPLEWAQRMQRVYNIPARAPARKAGKFPRHSAISLSPLFRVWEPEGSVGITSPRQIGGL